MTNRSKSLLSADIIHTLSLGLSIALSGLTADVSVISCSDGSNFLLTHLYTINKGLCLKNFAALHRNNIVEC